MLNINVWDLLWTFVNFFVLYCLLNKFLFQPLTSFMDPQDALRGRPKRACFIKDVGRG